ncbi:Crp/Fnr family transcriptional regulator [Campylobacter porcelli]|uniref:Crp/Fnr family transcriptional regulator n=1 Tax=Campylobacter porcelli TaxID=1660073 RepID=A0ABU7M3E9_9BACT|nr:Crp/Fnr family transcriptional regulator [Campylobacter sp. CX2-4855-23]MEE3776518.1 Crp/Fnr family transcriptional regulator [Campylobacter sp. CX2-4080-23]
MLDALKDKLKRFGVASQDLDRIEKFLQIRKFSDGSSLTKSHYGLLMIGSGSLRVYTIFGSQEQTILTLEKGDEWVICQICTQKSLELELNLQALGDLEIIIIPDNIFRDLRQKYPKLSEYILTIFAKQFAKSIEVASKSKTIPFRDRLVEFIRKNAINNGIKITHQQIANHLGVTRECVSKNLKQLEKNGLLTLSRGKIYLEM